MINPFNNKHIGLTMHLGNKAHSCIVRCVAWGLGGSSWELATTKIKYTNDHKTWTRLAGPLYPKYTEKD